MKVRRHEVEKLYASVIDGIYTHKKKVAKKKVAKKATK